MATQDHGAGLHSVPSSARCRSELLEEGTLRSRPAGRPTGRRARRTSRRGLNDGLGGVKYPRSRTPILGRPSLSTANADTDSVHADPDAMEIGRPAG